MKTFKLLVSVVIVAVLGALLFTGGVWIVRAADYKFWYAKEGNSGSVEGIARDVVIHSCNGTNTLDRPGYCNGTLRVEYVLEGKTNIQEVIVTSRIAIVVDGKSPSTLDSFPNAHVKVAFVERDGLNYATSVIATKH